MIWFRNLFVLLCIVVLTHGCVETDSTETTIPIDNDGDLVGFFDDCDDGSSGIGAREQGCLNGENCHRTGDCISGSECVLTEGQPIGPLPALPPVLPSPGTTTQQTVRIPAAERCRH